MDDDWVGRAVSIVCCDKLGVFQGIIKEADANCLTIVRAFRNGVPLRQPDAVIALRACDIRKINFIAAYDGPMSVTPTVINKLTPVKQPNFLSLSTVESIEQQQQQQQQQQAFNNAPSNADMNAFMMSCKNSPGFGVPQLPQPTELPPMPNDALLSPLSSRDPLAMQQLKDELLAAVAGALPARPEPSKAVNGLNNATSSGGGKDPASNNAVSVAQFFNNMIPPKVEMRLSTFLEQQAAANGGGGSGETKERAPVAVQQPQQQHQPQQQQKGRLLNGMIGGVGGGSTGSKPRSKSFSGNGHDSNNGSNGNGGGGNGGDTPNMKGSGQNRRRQQNALRRENSCRENQTFGASVDDPIMNEDFDFEGNLALFNKQKIWQTIDQRNEAACDNGSGSGSGGRAGSAGDLGDGNGKYRHDEDILERKPLQLRQIRSVFESSMEFVTDEGLIVPAIPDYVRSKIEAIAERHGLSVQRGLDALARGASDLAIMLLGGARRLTPNNSHQWPTVVIVCNKCPSKRAIRLGATTGRILGTHGLKVYLYTEEPSADAEVALFQATGNTVVTAVSDLPRPDLVVLSTRTNSFSEAIRQWINENRASTMAIDTPPGGCKGVSIKYSILPILPLNGIVPHKCGKLYLCNLGLPDAFYSEAGIEYKSPFGHKFVIPLHAKD